MFIGIGLPITRPSPAQAAAFSDPSDIDGLSMWLDAEDSTITLNGSPGDVASWGDLSGNSNAATQATATDQPALVTNVLNGKAVVRFVQPDVEWMTLPPAIGDILAATTTKTVFAVMKLTDTSTFGRVIQVNTAGTTSYALWVNGGELRLRYWNDAASTSEIAFEAAQTSAFKLYEARQNGANVETLVNGTSAATGSNASSLANPTEERLSGNSGQGGFDLAALLVYDNDVSSANRALIRAYLGTRFGLTVS